MKKTLLTTTAFALLSASLMAQGQRIQAPVKENIGVSDVSKQQGPSPINPSVHVMRCATPAPQPEWDAAFNKEVEKYKAEKGASMANGKTTATTFTLPVIFHVIHGGQAVGTFPNLAQAQINSQITAMNQDYSGVGYKANTYPTGAFAGYAAAATNSVSAASKDGTGRVAIANTGIQFVLATKDVNGNTLPEPGIDRINYSTKGWTNPATLTSANFQTYIDGTIKPASVWDVTKYFNVWLTDEDMTSANSPGLLGYSTFPPSSTLTGLSAPYGNASTDGCWFWSKVCGSKSIYASGTYDATYCYGRTISHECGHYLGLRHPWGDNGQCGGTDYCNDTPPEQGQATNQPYGCWYGTPTYPTNAATCTYGGQTNTNGDMFMNIMDYTDDVDMYMFTYDQTTRMQTALTKSPNRSNLTASAIAMGATSTTYSAPVAAFTYPTSICSNVATAFTDGSTGPPSTWAWSSNPSTGVVITNTNTPSPNITFPAAGTYTITLAVTNTVNTNSVSHVVTVATCTSAACDTLSNINNTDTLTIYKATAGYFMGTNSYGFTGLAEAYAQTQFPTGMQVKGAIVLFYRKTASIGTHGTGAVSVSMVNGTTPGGTAAATKTFSLSSVASTAAVTHVDYSGNPNLAYSTAIIVPYVATFATPVTLNSDFFLNVTPPTATTDTIALFSGRVNHTATNTAWIKYSGSWTDLKSATTGTANPNGSNYSIAIIPIACPVSTTSIENTVLGSNINLFPNPNSGQFNFAISLQEATNLNFTIVNMLGQVVYAKTENNVSNAVLSCDLSHLAKGIYYANITDSKNNKTVKKIIIE